MATEDEHPDSGSDDGATERKQPSRQETWLDNHFEPIFFKLRLLILFPVLVSFVGAILMFYLGSHNTYAALDSALIDARVNDPQVILSIIKALDAFLIGIIMIIFSFGVYDFFVSEIAPAKYANIRPDWFKFDSTGELKNKLVEVVLLILAIKFFEQIVANIDKFTSPVLYLVIPGGAAILAISIGFFKWSTAASH